MSYLSSGLQSIHAFLKAHVSPETGCLYLPPEKAALLIGNIGGYWGDALDLEKAQIADQQKQPAIDETNDKNVVRIDLWKVKNRKGDVA